VCGSLAPGPVPEEDALDPTAHDRPAPYDVHGPILPGRVLGAQGESKQRPWPSSSSPRRSPAWYLASG